MKIACVKAIADLRHGAPPSTIVAAAYGDKRRPRFRPPTPTISSPKQSVRDPRLHPAKHSPSPRRWPRRPGWRSVVADAAPNRRFRRLSPEPGLNAVSSSAPVWLCAENLAHCAHREPKRLSNWPMARPRGFAAGWRNRGASAEACAHPILIGPPCDVVVAWRLQHLKSGACRLDHRRRAGVRIPSNPPRTNPRLKKKPPKNLNPNPPNQKTHLQPL